MPRFRLGDPHLAAPRTAITIGIVGMVLAFVVGLIAKAMHALVVDSFSVDTAINAVTFHGSDALAKTLDAIDKPVVVAIILLLILLFFGLWRGILPTVGAVLATGIGWLLCAAVKLVVREPRPAGFAHFANLNEQALSYPSGHVTFVVALAVAIGVLLAGSPWRALVSVVLWLLAAVTAWSRLYVGVHYPVDILGALIGGVGGTVLVLGLWNRFAPALLARLGVPRRSTGAAESEAL